MKRLAVILVPLVIVVAGYLLLRGRLAHTPTTVPSPAKVTPVSFTDSNGNQFTVYIGGVLVNGTNVVVSNLNVKIHPAPPGTPPNQQTNETSK